MQEEVKASGGPPDPVPLFIVMNGWSLLNGLQAPSMMAHFFVAWIVYEDHVVHERISGADLQLFPTGHLHNIGAVELTS